jgi:hypothetical protein
VTILFYLLFFLVLGSGFIWLFLTTPAARMASFFSNSAPIAIVAIGGILTLLGRGAIGIPMAAIGLAWWRRARGMGSINSPSGGQKSTVRSAVLEMELDHETGEMDGIVLAGQREGKRLSQMDDSALFMLLEDVQADQESAALFEAYLDRRIPGWREDTEAHAGGGQGSTAASGTMTKQEAYQVLGLEPGASRSEIQAAWRKLMKSMHPDSGGSEFLAAKINAAKDVLLD